MLRIAKESQQVKGYVIELKSTGYALVRYHSDYGVYTHETVVEAIKCKFFPGDKGFKKAIEEAVRNSVKDLPKILYIEETIFEDNFADEDDEFEEIISPGDDGYGDGDDDFLYYI